MSTQKNAINFFDNFNDIYCISKRRTTVVNIAVDDLHFSNGLTMHTDVCVSFLLPILAHALLTSDD